MSQGLILSHDANSLVANGASPKKSDGRRVFVALLVLLLATTLFVYERGVLLPDLAHFDSSYSQLAVALGLVFHVQFALLVAALVAAISQQPGAVPEHWGFYVGDEARRMRYCGVCKIWKPDRAHHCSQCNKCVLNMDHHCPWINNCVGFYNRKFFIQILFYSNAVILTSLAHVALKLANSAFGLSLNFSKQHVARQTELPLSLALLVLGAVLMIGLAPFTRFHWHLLISNSTTIESLDRLQSEHSRFDIGVRRNIEQVFGRNICLWWLPAHTAWSRPEGDGIRWRRLYSRNTYPKIV